MEFRRHKKSIVTIIIVTLLVPIVSAGIGDTLFGMQTKKEISNLFSSSGNISDRKFNYQQLAGLPVPVQRYFHYCLEEGQAYISYAKLKHEGTFRQDAKQGWIPIKGEEYFTADKPGFVWAAKLSPFPFFWFSGKDSYVQGKGEFQVKLLSLITVAEAKGKGTDEGELMRWLVETVWFPTALLPSEHLHWEAIDSNSARAVLTSDGLKVNLTVVINDKGEIVEMIGDRYVAAEGSYQMQKWIVRPANYIRIEGITIPREIEASWLSQSEEFSYARFTINEIRFNDPSQY